LPDLTTQLIHHPYQPPGDFVAPQVGVFKASTVIFPTARAMRERKWQDKSAFTYGLHGTPTTYMLEERLCTLEAGLYCVLVPSGLAAIAVVALALLQSGDSILVPDNVYGPNKALADGQLARWGITTQVYDAMDSADLAAKITDHTRLVWVEAAGSVTLEFPDLPALVRTCQARGVLCALDNTWGAGLAFNPFDLLPSTNPALGVDISVHALTKYPSGGGDVLMGSVITRDPALYRKIQRTHMHLGLNVGANDAELVLRSLSSIALRYRAHDAATRTLARWCTQQPAFAQVLHPSLPESPGHAHWLKLCRSDAAAGLFSVVVDAKYTSAQVDTFCDALQLFKIGYSWGGPISLVVPYELASMRMQWPAGVARGTLVRFAVGLESVADLQADLAHALQTLVASC
jgi:cystathionine beta-lyase